MWLEVGLIDLANLADNTKLMDLEARIARLEGGEVIPPQRTITKPALPPVIEKVVPIKTETPVIRFKACQPLQTLLYQKHLFKNKK